MKKLIKIPKKQPAQSLVELALTVTVLILVISGAVDFGMAFFSYVTLHDAAQEGAIYGSIEPADDAGIIQRVRAASTTPVDLSDSSLVDVSIQKSSPACTGGWIRVTVDYDHVMFMPFFSGRVIPLSAQVTDTILQPKCP